MRRDIGKLIRQKALQGDTEFFKSVSLTAFSSESKKVDCGTVTVKDSDDNAFIEDCPEE